MNTRLLLVAVLSLGLAACAGTPGPVGVPQESMPISGQLPVEEPASTLADAADLATKSADNATSSAVDTAALAGIDATAHAPPGIATVDDGVPTAAEDDYAALYGEAPSNTGSSASAYAPYDPWEPLNRSIHAINNVVDRAVARPLATAYVTVVPRPLRLGVTNFFDNLSSPLTLVNQLLQGRPRHAAQTLGRFVVNSTLGIGGIFDPASDLKMKRRSEDFGQTLGIWGWRSSRYVELPLFGPRTLRDVLGLVGDAPLSVSPRVEEDKLRLLMQGVQLVDTRAQLLALDSLRDSAPDEYAIVRDAWLKRRTFQIESDRRNRQQDDTLPDYLQEDEDWERNPTVPVDAMPLPILTPSG